MCLSSDPRRARDVLQLPIWARARDYVPTSLDPADGERSRRVHWWDEGPPAAAGPPSSRPFLPPAAVLPHPSPTGPSGGAAGEGEGAPQTAPVVMPAEGHGDRGLMHPQPPQPVGQAEDGPDVPSSRVPPQTFDEEVGGGPDTSVPAESGADAGAQRRHQPTDGPSQEESSSEGESHAPTTP
jgi:hypothetical protein